MPQINVYKGTVTIEYEVRGNDFTSVARLIAEQIKPALEPPSGGDIPYLSSVPHVRRIDIIDGH